MEVEQLLQIQRDQIVQSAIGSHCFQNHFRSLLEEELLRRKKREFRWRIVRAILRCCCLVEEELVASADRLCACFPNY